MRYSVLIYDSSSFGEGAATFMGYSGLDLSSKIAVVIGGSSGIGRTLALGLAQAGAHVVATGRRQELVTAVSNDIEALGRKSLAITADVGNRASLEALHAAVCAEFGHVDILVNSAGITKKAPTLEVSDSEWGRILDTNLSGTLRACQVFARKMMERKYGRIINIASLASSRGFFQVAAYGASKAGVLSLTQTLAVEWAKHGVCVNAIVPGFFVTELNHAILQGTPRGQEALARTPMGRFGKLDELVGAAIFLASDAASFVTGHALAVDGGYLASGVNQ